MKSVILENLINIIATLPGLGPKSAKRIVLHMLKNDHKLIKSMIILLQEVADNIKDCSLCGNLDTTDPCYICSAPHRKQDKLCIVEEVGDLWNIENSGHFDGLYYVVGGTISKGNALSSSIFSGLEKLLHRVASGNIVEVIVANNPTINGQTTGFYIIERLKEVISQHGLGTNVTSLGRGIPIGAEIDYLDESTIEAAFETRKKVG